MNCISIATPIRGGAYINDQPDLSRVTVCGIALTPDGPRFVVIANDDGGIVPALIEYVEPDEEEAVLH